MSTLLSTVLSIALLLECFGLDGANASDVAASSSGTTLEWRGAEAADMWRRGCRGPWCAVALPRLEMGDWVIRCESYHRGAHTAASLGSRNSSNLLSTTSVMSVAWTSSTIVVPRASTAVESLTSTRRANASMLIPIRAASAEELPRHLSSALPWWWGRHASNIRFVNPSLAAAGVPAATSGHEAEVIPVSVLHLASHLRERWVCSLPLPAPVPPAMTARRPRLRRQPANRQRVRQPHPRAAGDEFLGESSSAEIAGGRPLSDEPAVLPPSTDGFEAVRLELHCADSKVPNLFSVVVSSASPTTAAATARGSDVLYCAILFDISPTASWTAKVGVWVLFLAALAFGALIAYLIASPARARRIASMRMEKKFDDWDQASALRKSEWMDGQQRTGAARVSCCGGAPPSNRRQLRATGSAKARDENYGHPPSLAPQWDAVEFVDDPSRGQGALPTYPIDGPL